MRLKQLFSKSTSDNGNLVTDPAKTQPAAALLPLGEKDGFFARKARERAARKAQKVIQNEAPNVPQTTPVHHPPCATQEISTSPAQQHPNLGPVFPSMACDAASLADAEGKTTEPYAVAWPDNAASLQGAKYAVDLDGKQEKGRDVSMSAVRGVFSQGVGNEESDEEHEDGQMPVTDTPVAAPSPQLLGTSNPAVMTRTESAPASTSISNSPRVLASYPAVDSKGSVEGIWARGTTPSGDAREYTNPTHTVGGHKILAQYAVPDQKGSVAGTALRGTTPSAYTNPAYTVSGHKILAQYAVPGEKGSVAWSRARNNTVGGRW